MKKKQTSPSTPKSNFFSTRFLFLFFVSMWSTLCLISSGIIESQDGWLYLSVAKNIYYKHSIEAIPDYYPKLNVHMNSAKGADGVWRAPGSLGYSLSMVPAVALSDIVHHLEGSTPSTYFPLEHDWSLHFFASFTNALYGAILTTIILVYICHLTGSKKTALLGALLTIYSTNLLPLSKFGFAHILFTTFVVLSFYSLRRFVIDGKRIFLLVFSLAYAMVFIAYNVSYYLPIIPLVMYYFLLLPSHKRIGQLKIIAILSVLFLIWKGEFILLIGPSLIRVSPKVLIEGLWGFLFSSGKSVFVFSPPLLIPFIFWHKLNKKYLPEIISFSVLSLLYLFFLGSAWIPGADGNKVPIWHGGMVWGPRYISTLIPFGMIIAALLLPKLSKIQNFLIVIPVIICGLWVQLIGISLPYLLQYQNTPSYGIYIGNQELSIYDYGSFEPRFMPLYTMSRDFIVKLAKFPESRNHGSYNVWFYDGFEVPLFTGAGPYRGFREEGHIFFDSSSEKPVNKLFMSFYNAPDVAESTSSAQVKIVVNNKQVATTEIGSSQNGKLTVDLQDHIKSGRNTLDLYAHYPATTSATQVVYISQMVLNDTNINLESLDYPVVSTGGDTHSPIKYQYFGKKMNDRWKLWYLRARITERTFDFWWIKNLYYWDRPQMLIAGLFIANLSVSVSSWIILRRYWKKYETTV